MSPNLVAFNGTEMPQTWNHIWVLFTFYEVKSMSPLPNAVG